MPTVIFILSAVAIALACWVIALHRERKAEREQFVAQRQKDIAAADADVQRTMADRDRWRAGAEAAQEALAAVRVTRGKKPGMIPARSFVEARSRAEQSEPVNTKASTGAHA